MTVDLENLRTITQMSQVQVVFGEGGSVANATSLNVAPSNTDITTASMTVIVPPNVDAKTVLPFVRVLGFGTTAPFQSQFTYLTPPDPAIVEIFPARGDIATPTTVSITLNFFAGVTSLTDIVIIMVGVEAEIVSWSRLNAGQKNPLLPRQHCSWTRVHHRLPSILPRPLCAFFGSAEFYIFQFIATECGLRGW